LIAAIAACYPPQTRHAPRPQTSPDATPSLLLRMHVKEPSSIRKGRNHHAEPRRLRLCRPGGPWIELSAAWPGPSAIMLWKAPLAEAESPRTEHIVLRPTGGLDEPRDGFELLRAAATASRRPQADGQHPPFSKPRSRSLNRQLRGTDKMVGRPARVVARPRVFVASGGVKTTCSKDLSSRPRRTRSGKAGRR